MVKTFLLSHWKKVLIGTLFSLLIAALWAYRAEIKDHAQTMVQVTGLQQEVESSQDRLDQAIDRRNRTYLLLHRYERESQEVREAHRQLIRETADADDEDLDAWRSDPLPPALLDRLRDAGVGQGSGDNH